MTIISLFSGDELKTGWSSIIAAGSGSIVLVGWLPDQSRSGAKSTADNLSLCLCTGMQARARTPQKTVRKSKSKDTLLSLGAWMPTKGRSLNEPLAHQSLAINI